MLILIVLKRENVLSLLKIVIEAVQVIIPS